MSDFLEDYGFLILLVLATIIGFCLVLFVPMPQSYTLYVDGVEYNCIDFDVEQDFIELFDHHHGGFFCSEKCSREYIPVAEKSFVVIKHSSSVFERWTNAK